MNAKYSTERNLGRKISEGTENRAEKDVRKCARLGDPENRKEVRPEKCDRSSPSDLIEKLPLRNQRQLKYHDKISTDYARMGAVSGSNWRNSQLVMSRMYWQSLCTLAALSR